MTDDLSVLPAERRATAEAALAAAFGASPVSDLRPVGGGASGALTYRLEMAGRPYLLRMETRRDAFRNPHQYACMRAAAEAGIAPPLRHADDAAGIAIMDFLPQHPLAEFPGGAGALVRASATLIARLQAETSFPPLAGYLDILSRLFGFVRGSSLFAPGLLDVHAEGLARIRGAYAVESGALVSGHNDPNPFNLLFDGERLWLIDWETAYRNDPLTDVAILAENFAPTPELEDLLLGTWLGRTPDRRTRARFRLMRLLTRLYYAGLIFSGFAAAPRTAPDSSLTALTPDAFRSAVAEGRLVVGAPETTYAMGKLYLAGFLDGLAAPGFEEALAIAQIG